LSPLETFKRPLPAFAVASLFAVSVGAVVCAMSGVPTSLWVRNLVAWLMGGVTAVTLARWAGPRTLLVVAIGAPLGIAASFLYEGQEGVRRWLELGPVRLNAAMLLLPALVVALASLAPRAAWWWIAALITVGVLVLQPDASQAAALALAVSVIVFGVRKPSAPFAWGIALAALALAAFSWTRPDPLAPVAEVEGVVGLALRLSPVLAGLAVLSIAAFAVAPAAVVRGAPADQARWAGYALTTLFLVWSVAPALGAFPVPLVGVGPSPILGAWLGVGLLAAHRDDGG
jgi:hypothetical protein